MNLLNVVATTVLLSFGAFAQGPTSEAEEREALQTLVPAFLAAFNAGDGAALLELFHADSENLRSGLRPADLSAELKSLGAKFGKGSTPEVRRRNAFSGAFVVGVNWAKAGPGSIKLAPRKDATGRWLIFSFSLEGNKRECQGECLESAQRIYDSARALPTEDELARARDLAAQECAEEASSRRGEEQGTGESCELARRLDRVLTEHAAISKARGAKLARLTLQTRECAAALGADAQRPEWEVAIRVQCGPVLALCDEDLASVFGVLPNRRDLNVIVGGACRRRACDSTSGTRPEFCAKREKRFPATPEVLSFVRAVFERTLATDVVTEVMTALAQPRHPIFQGQAEKAPRPQ